MLATFLIPPRPEFALKEEVILVSRSTSCETNACRSKRFEGTKDLDSYELEVIEGTMEEIIGQEVISRIIASSQDAKCKNLYKFV